jgi:16S rRNA (guanine966-N2)-methyltransferase
MRIIAGKYRGRRLKSPSSSQTRPTSDRLRETLFNVLAPRVEGSRFLDLCAGTGAVGIEALSRGAAHVTFVDKSKKTCALIKANADGLEIDASKLEIVTAEAAAYLRRREIKSPFDIIFFDPPYDADYQSVLTFIGKQTKQLMFEEGVLIVEHFSKQNFAETLGQLTAYRTLKQGDSSLSFYREPN